MNDSDSISDSDFKFQVVERLSNLSSELKRLASHLESEIGTQERAYGRLETSVKACTEEMKAMHEKVFVGNGSPSVLTRIDRLEQTQSTRAGHFALLWAAIIGLFTIAAGEWIAGRLSAQSNQPAISAPANAPSIKP